MINIFCKACVFFPLESWANFHFGPFIFGFLSLLLCVDCWPVRDIRRDQEILAEFLVFLNFQCEFLSVIFVFPIPECN